MQKIFFKSKSSREATESSVSGSAKVTGALPSASSANSAGASTDAAEFSQNLDNVLNTLDREEILNLQQQNIVERLQKVCEEYEEGHVPSELADWQHDNATIELVTLAADCADLVYKRKEKFYAEGITRPTAEYEIVGDILPTLDGSVKAALVGVHTESQTLIVAIRGTANMIDWVTNANGAPVEAKDFFPRAAGIKVHSGFLYSAQHMLKDIEQAMTSCKDKVKRILFTGHSAGGAVALLLFAHFKWAYTFAPLEHHCITFAAPPTSRPALTEYAPVFESSKVLSFVVQGDPVPRADRPYARTLTDVYARPNPRKPVNFETSELENAGVILLLHDRNSDEDEDDIRISDATDRLSGLLFGNTSAHRMKSYLSLLSAWLRQNGLVEDKKTKT